MGYTANADGTYTVYLDSTVYSFSADDVMTRAEQSFGKLGQLTCRPRSEIPVHTVTPMCGPTGSEPREPHTFRYDGYGYAWSTMTVTGPVPGRTGFTEDPDGKLSRSAQFSGQGSGILGITITSPETQRWTTYQFRGTDLVDATAGGQLAMV